jgi:hypothetical protein
MNDAANIRPTAQAKGYLDTLTSNGSFSRAIDAYVLAAAFAMRADLDQESVVMKGRTDLISVGRIDNYVRIALECGVMSIRKRKGLEPLGDAAAMLEQVTKYAEVGMEALKERWDGKTGLQIQYDIKKLVAES